MDLNNLSKVNIATRRITRPGLEVSEFAFGAAPIGNFRFNISDEEAHGAMSAAWAGGCRYFDTSPFYGYGRSELRVGQFLRNMGDEPYVLSSKVGRWMRPLRASDDVSILRKGGLPFVPNFDPSYDGTMRSLEQSFLRLGLNHIDIVFIHDIDAFTHGSNADTEPLFELAMNGAYRALTELRSSGEIIAIGAGINETSWCRRFVEAGDFDCMMLAGRYSLLEHSQETLELFDLCRTKNVGLLLAGVFNSGLLAGGSKSGASFHYKPTPKNILQQVEKIEAICQVHKISLSAAAIQFVLSEPLVKSAVIGATCESESLTNLIAYRSNIPPQFWSDMKSEGLIPKNLPAGLNPK
jgi:D-threo-aldose 1-dehydrogenase